MPRCWQNRCSGHKSCAGNPCGSSKPRSEGEPVPFTLHQELPCRGAGKTAVPATRVTLATRAAPPLGIFCSMSNQNLKVWCPLILCTFTGSCNPEMLVVSHLGSFPQIVFKEDDMHPENGGVCHLTLLITQDLCTHREASITSLTSKRYILRFPALETLMLDDNRLSNPSCFASLAGLRRLKKLSLDENRIIRIPYLQQVQLYDESEDWIGGRESPQKEPQFMLQSKPWMLEDSDEQLDYTVLPMREDVDQTGE
ncbi:hypothetical protein P7K49_022322 [Saguinus oedipus]|uniref:Uncharacterized protein n=1 Tax=Saguinus oedipus TaxID=9490 RepID=A0ABQ9UW03_SAGOE|nr:hypothetical protein P7K49_022322 [Saguinus oedipus]